MRERKAKRKGAGEGGACTCTRGRKDMRVERGHMREQGGEGKESREGKYEWNIVC